MGPTRTRTTEFLETASEPVALADIVRATGLRDNTVRHHLGAPERAGLVETEARRTHRSGRGRSSRRHPVRRGAWGTRAFDFDAADLFGDASGEARVQRRTPPQGGQGRKPNRRNNGTKVPWHDTVRSVYI